METSSASQVIIIIIVILLLLITIIIIIIIVIIIIITTIIIIIIVITIIVVFSITKNKCTLYYSHLLKVLDIPMEHKLNLKLKRIECPDRWNNISLALQNYQCFLLFRLSSSGPKSGNLLLFYMIQLRMYMYHPMHCRRSLILIKRDSLVNNDCVPLS